MEQYQKRVVAEKVELDNKISALDSFTKGPHWHTVSDEEKIRLRRQFGHMEQYSAVLADRINNF